MLQSMELQLDATEEKIYANHICDKDLAYRKHKELSKPNSKKTKNPIQNWKKSSVGFTKEDIKMRNKEM